MQTLSARLVNQKIASVQDVEKALEQQALYGGDLATNLIEIGAVAEAGLTELLAESLGLEAAPSGELPRAADAARRLLPGDSAWRHGFYPLDEGAGRLHLAVSEPLPEVLRQDIEFSLGVSIVEYAAPLVRIRQAIARDYNLPLDRRTARVVARLHGDPDPFPSAAPQAASEPERRPLWSPSIPPQTAPVFDELVPSTQGPSFGSDGHAALFRPFEAFKTEKSTSVPGQAGKLAAAEPPAPESATPPAERESLPPPTEPGDRTRGAPAWVSRSPLVGAFRSRWLGPLTSEVAEQAMFAAPTRDQLLSVFFAFVSQYFDYSALFAVHGDLAEGRDARGPGASRARLNSIGVPLDLPSTLAFVRDSGEPLFVRLSDQGLDGGLVQDLERSPGQKILLLPVTVRGRGVLILYGDHGNDDVDPVAVGDVITFAQLASKALEIVILRRKKSAPYAQLPDNDERILGDSLPPGPPRDTLVPTTLAARQDLVAAAEAPGARNETSAFDAPATPAVPPAAAATGVALAAETAAAPGAAAASSTAAALENVAATAAEAPTRPEAAIAVHPNNAHETTSARPLSLSARPDALPIVQPIVQIREVPDLVLRTPAPPTRGLSSRPPLDAPPEEGWELEPKTRPGLGAEALAFLQAEPRVSPLVEHEGAATRRGGFLRPAWASAEVPNFEPPPEPNLAAPSADSLPAAPNHVPTVPAAQPAATPSSSPKSVIPALQLKPMDLIEDGIFEVPQEKALARPSLGPTKPSSPSDVRGTSPSLHAGAGPSAGQSTPLGLGADPAAATDRVTHVPVAAVDDDTECQELTRQLLAGEPGIGARLLEAGAPAAKALAAVLPGPLNREWVSGGPRPMRASECGPVLHLLARLGSVAVPYVALRTHDANPSVRVWATRLLGELPGPGSASSIVDRLVDDNPGVRQAAMESSLAMRSETAVSDVELTPRLRSLAADATKSDYARQAAIESLTNLRDQEAVGLLIDLLPSSSEIVRDAARRALRIVTRQDFGLSSEPWRAWWQAHAAAHRIEWLIDATMHSDANLRREAGDELKTLTKEYFGYYDDLPEKERARAQQRYREWWQTRGKDRFRR